MAGTIRVVREKKGWANRARRFSIWINDEEAGAIKRGETLDLAVAPGEFSVRAGIDWTGSPTLRGTIADGQTLTYVVENGDVRAGLVDREAYLCLRPVD